MLSDSPHVQMASRGFMTLLQFAGTLSAVVNRHPGLQNVWVAAELSDVRVVGGHCYAMLVEKDAAGQDVANMRATIWASVFYRLRAKFLHSTGREITGGMKVLLCGSASCHPKFGVSFNVSDIDPSYTLGNIERLRREILSRLHAEGVLGANRSLPLPEAPQRVAVISADGAAGYGDFINQLTGNRRGFVFYPMLFPALMQGTNTAPSVLKALDRVEMTVDLWDCVVIVRGGGATTDMTGFDDYDLAYRVATFPIPVIVGIGHERDRNVLDEIACVRCKTPTAAAAFLIDKVGESYDAIQNSIKGIMDYASARMGGEATRLAHIMAAVPAAAKSILDSAGASLDRIASEIPLSVGAFTQKKYLELARNIDSLKHYVANITMRESERLKRDESLLEVLDPADTLKRGYSITRVNGHAVTAASDVREGDVMVTTLAVGIVRSVCSSSLINGDVK